MLFNECGYLSILSSPIYGLVEIFSKILSLLISLLLPFFIVIVEEKEKEIVMEERLVEVAKFKCPYHACHTCSSFKLPNVRTVHFSCFFFLRILYCSPISWFVFVLIRILVLKYRAFILFLQKKKSCIIPSKK